MKKVSELKKGDVIEFNNSFERIVDINKGFWSGSKILDFKSGLWSCMDGSKMVSVKS